MHIDRDNKYRENQEKDMPKYIETGLQKKGGGEERGDEKEDRWILWKACLSFR